MRFKPMLAKKNDHGKLPSGDYAFELKWDGIRAMIEVGDDVKIFSRNGRNITKQFPELAEDAWEALAYGCVYDAEIIVPDPAGKPSFPLVTSRLHLGDDISRRKAAKLTPATAMLFDFLASEFNDWTTASWRVRRKMLRANVKPTKRFKVSPITRVGDKLLDYAYKEGLEGIMAKDANELYYPGKRHRSWLKIKCKMILDVYVVGYTDGAGKRDGVFGALILEDLRGNDCGRVGTGFQDVDLERYWTMLQAVGVDRVHKGIYYLKRKLPAEVQAMYRTDAGVLREPVFRTFK